MVSPFFEVINFGRGRRSIDEVLRPKSVLFDFDADCLDSEEMVKILDEARRWANINVPVTLRLKSTIRQL